MHDHAAAVETWKLGDLVRYTGSLTAMHGMYRIGVGCVCGDCYDQGRRAVLLYDWTANGFPPDQGSVALACVRWAHITLVKPI